MKKHNLELASFSAIHFLVDLACIFLVTVILLPLMPQKTTWLWCALMYNLFAFALQLPVGALGDVLGRPKKMAAIGCLLVALAYLIVGLVALPNAGVSLLVSSRENVSALFGIARKELSWFAFTAAVIAGIGNSCFHVGGGINTLHQAKGKATRPGIFVATGAMGVYLASKLPAGHMTIIASLATGIIIMVASAALLFSLDKNGEAVNLQTTETTGVPAPASSKGVQVPAPSKASNTSGVHHPSYPGITLLLLTVCIRSYTGGLFSYSWKAAPLLATLFILGVVLGKMAGGIVGDRFGWEKSSLLSLLISQVLFHFAPASPFCGILGVLLFNMTMPITLMAIANNLGPNMYGTAFGMTTTALFLGTLPSTFQMFNNILFSPGWMIPLTIIISAAATYIVVILTGNGSRGKSVSGPTNAVANGGDSRSLEGVSMKSEGLL